MTDLNDALAQLTTEGQARTLRFERRLKQAPAKVWAAITVPARIEAWLYAKDIEIEPRVGGRYHLHFTNSDHEMENVVTRWEPETVFEHSFGAPDSLVCWTVEPDGDGTRLTLTHRIAEADQTMTLRTLAGWHDVLAQMNAGLAGRDRDWDVKVWEGFQTRYAEAYGSTDTPEGDLIPRGDKAEIRYERRLKHPVANVWAALTDPERLPMWFAEMNPNTAIGESFNVRFPHAPQYKSAGVLTAYEPQRVLAWDWDDAGEVRFELEPDGEGTKLVLTHTTPQLWNTADFGAGWHIHLDALIKLLGTGKATAIKHDHGLEACYAARFNPPPKPAA